jgi:mRNA-degrading endonuclease RelE of RelBE toxin-antitoxin system
MTPPFSVRTTPHFERLARVLLKRHPEFRSLQERAVAILKADPKNRSRAHDILKLEGIQPGEGQYRLRVGRYRLRYDVDGQDVTLGYCGRRREDTYG